MAQLAPGAGSVLAAGLLSCSVAVAGCAAASTNTVTVSGSTLTIYVSEPPSQSGRGPDVLAAEQLALAESGSRVGQFTLHLQVLRGKVSNNARTAIEDKTAIAYLGEIDPGTSADALGITNAQDLLQVSPTDTGLELTRATPAVANSPKVYYESFSTYGHTFARVVPNSAVEARAQVEEMRRVGVSRLYLTDDGSDYGRAMVQAVREDVTGFGITIVSNQAGADAVFDGARSFGQAQATFNHAAASSPTVKLFGPSALYDPAFATGLSPQVRSLYISLPAPPRSTSHAMHAFARRLQDRTGRAPVPEAVFGYEAMKGLLAALAQAGSQASNRATVAREFLSLKRSDGLLGSYSIGATGDSTLRTFAFGRLHAGGRLVPFATVQG